MAVWKMSADDYAKFKASEKFHFLHLNATSHDTDKMCYHVTFSDRAAQALGFELGIKLVRVVHHPNTGLRTGVDHPEGANFIPHDHLRKTALNAPGFNERTKK